MRSHLWQWLPLDNWRVWASVVLLLGWLLLTNAITANLVQQANPAYFVGSLDNARQLWQGGAANIFILVMAWLGLLGLAAGSLRLNVPRITLLCLLLWLTPVIANALGSGLLLAWLGYPMVFSPMRLISHYYRFYTDFPRQFIVSYAVSYSIAIALPIAYVFSILRQLKQAIYGQAHFATVLDLATHKMLWQGQEGLFLGRFNGFRLFSKGFEHVLLVAGSGLWKSSAFVVNNVLYWRGSQIVNDLSDELFTLTAAYCQQKKNTRVFRFAPTAAKTHRWNPYDRIIKLEQSAQFAALQHLAMTVISSQSDTPDRWTAAARELFVALSLYLIATQQSCTLGDIAELIRRPNFDDWLDKNALATKGLNTQFYLAANSYLGINADETRAGIYFNLTSHLNLYLDPIIRAATSQTDFDLSQLRKEKMTIYIGIPDKEIIRLAPIVTMFWEEAIAAMTQHPPREDEPYPVLFNMDEFGSLNRIDRFRKNINLLRKYRVRVAMIFQYLDQMGEKYNRAECKAFLNTKTKIFYCQNDMQDAEYVEKHLGTKTKRYKTKTYRQRERATSEQFTKTSLMTADEIRRLPLKQQLILIAGVSAIKARKLQWFKDRKWKNIQGLPIQMPTQSPIHPIATASDLTQSPNHPIPHPDELLKNELID